MKKVKNENIIKIIVAGIAALIIVACMTAPAHASDPYSELMSQLPNFNTIVEETVGGGNILDTLDKVAQGDLLSGPDYTEEEINQIASEFEGKATSLAKDLDESLGLLIQADENGDDRPADEICANPFARITQTLEDLWNMFKDLLGDFGMMAE